METLTLLIPPLLAWGLAPLLLGVIARSKAWLAGRQGPPWVQPYRDLARLLRKGAVYSRTTTAVFRAGPIVSLAALGVATLVVPLGDRPATVAFAGDAVVMVLLLGLARLATVWAALDTGSSFEGMGASREVHFAALAEPALLVALGAAARFADGFSLSEMTAGITAVDWVQWGPALGLIVVALGVVLLAENARIPVDDPATHLELTMIHEVMVLDHGGPDLAFIEYGVALKLWLLAALLAGIALPLERLSPVEGTVAALGGVFGVGLLVGVVESVMARLRLLMVPQLLVGGAALAVVAIILTVR